MRRLPFDKNFFSREDEKAYYWAGFIAADGCIHQNKMMLAVADKDLSHLLQFKSDIGSEHKVTRWTNANGTIMNRISIRSNDMINVLREHFNIVSQKSASYTPPYIYDKEMRRHFWRGMFDGDGCAILTNGRLVMQFAGSLESVNSFIELAKDSGVLFKHTPSRKGRIYTTTYMDSSAVKLHHFLYHNSTRRLNRKYVINGTLQLS